MKVDTQRTVTTNPLHLAFDEAKALGGQWYVGKFKGSYPWTITAEPHRDWGQFFYIVNARGVSRKQPTALELML